MRSILSLFTLLFASQLLAQVPVSKAKWIVYPEDFAAGLEKPRYYRLSFQVREGLKNAVVHWVLDDVGFGRIDGQDIPRSLQFQERYGLSANVESMLKPGMHTLAFRVTNLAGAGGIIARLELNYNDGTSEQFVSNKTWKTSTQEADNWQLPTFDDSQWMQCMEFAEALSSPWSNLRDMTTFLTPDEQKSLAEHRRIREAKIAEILAKIKDEPPANVKVIYDKGKAKFQIGDKLHEAIIYNVTEAWNADYPNFQRQIQQFKNANINLYSMGLRLPRIWNADGSIDFKKIDKLFIDALALNPDAYFIYDIIAFVQPDWWLNKYPDELIDYANGGVNPRETDTLQRVRAPSYASQVWRREITDVIRRIVTHIERAPYAKRVFAYRPDFGVYHEWHYYGMASGMPDTSKPMTRQFQSWLRKRYGNDVNALKKAWGQPDVTFDNATVPDKANRMQRSAGIFRDPIKDRYSVDYLECMAEVVRDCLFDFNRAAKEACNGRALVGNYFGYFFGNPFPAEGWHLLNDEILDSPYVDFQVSPQCYGNHMRALGEAQPARMLAEAYRRRSNKVAIIEADSRTCLEPKSGGHTHVDTPEQSVTTLARDFVQALTLGCSYWPYDFGKVWYNHPKMHQMFKELQPIRTIDADCRSNAEILYVGDFKSIIFSNVLGGSPAYTNPVSMLFRELSHTGAPVDTASFNDLASGQLKDYKLYIFPNLYYVTPDQVKVVQQLQRQNKAILWLYAPGYLTPDGASVQSMQQLTGFNIKQLPGQCKTITYVDGREIKSLLPGDLEPVLQIDDPSAEIIGTSRYGNTSIATYAKKGNAYLATAAFIDRIELRKIFQNEKIHCYNDDNDAVVYANSSFIGFHTKNPGPQTIRLPRKVTVKMLYPKQETIGTNIDQFTFLAPAESTTIFIYE